MSKKVTEEMIVCEMCGGMNIETKAWVDVHTDEVLDSCSDGDDEDNWCRDCGSHVGFMTFKQFKKCRRITKS